MAQNIEKMFAVRKIIKHYFPLQRSSERNSGLEGCVHVHVTGPLHKSQETETTQVSITGERQRKNDTYTQDRTALPFKEMKPCPAQEQKSSWMPLWQVPRKPSSAPPHAQVGSEILNWQSREFNSTYRGLRVGDGTEKGGADRGLPS